MPERPRVLIVDDDPLDRQALVRALQDSSAQVDGIEADVREADTIAQARAALRDAEFACVFLDHSLPDGTSLDLILEVRSQGFATPIIVLTGERDERIVLEVMRAGAIDYLPKQKLSPDLIARSLRVALRFLQVQREKEGTLAELRARDRALAAASNGIVIVDPHQPDYPLVYVNEAFLRMTGYTEAEVLGRNCRFLQGEGTDPAAVRELREAVLGGWGCHVPMLNYCKDGTPFWNEVTLSPVRDARGGLTHFVGVQADTTARHEAEGERRRIAERQTNIAMQLQAALQPPLPQAVAGLKLAKYYEVALVEAGVGGDFFDVFAVEKGCTALVVGDLAGKGLFAAAQVATVRNMLRAFLYSKPTLAEAVTDLNRVLTLNGLLSDFATLWVGCYDGATGELAYVNMGQEPALLRRAKTGAVEELLPTGPVLGADETAAYQERTVVLLPGDALVVFTDGVTECGPNRREMLGIEGVTALLGTPFAPEETQSAARMAEAVTLRLVEGVDAASRGGVPKDDLCILVAVADGASPGPGSGRL